MPAFVSSKLSLHPTSRHAGLALSRPSPAAWIPVIFGLAVICFESTQVMGGDRTARWLSEIWPTTLGQVSAPFFGEVHHLLRKLGHFTGYGMLGLLLRKAWYNSVRIYLKMIGNQLMFAASALSVSCIFLIGSLDEWHQSMVPGRTSTCRDVLIDTGGALLFNAIFWAIRARRRSALRTHRPLKLDPRPRPSGRSIFA
jgi:VanZ family protein